MTSRLLIILLGEACSGKTTLEKKITRLLPVESLFIVTDRKPRPDDIYSFVSPDDIPRLKASGDYLYWIDTNEDTTYLYHMEDDIMIQMVSFLNDKDAIGIKKNADDDVRVVTVRIRTDKENVRKCYEERGYDKETIEKRLSLSKETMDVDLEVTRENGFRKVKTLVNNFMREFERK